MQSHQNFLIVLKFVGTNFHGWQIQKNAVSVQEMFQNALFKVTKSIVDIKGCSRTDSGVHANSYGVSVKLNINIDERNLVLAINKFLPNDIRVMKCIKVDDKFHARYSCIAKEYKYLIYHDYVLDPFFYGRCLHFWHPLDIELMNDLASIFIGIHDFSAFCTSDLRDKKNMKRHIYYFVVKEEDNLVEFRIKANGFLYNMARILVGTLLEANYHKITKDDLVDIMLSKDRKFAGDTAPACGLYLNKVFYEEFTI